MAAVLDLADLAAEQWGLVTTSQARAVGVSAQAVARLKNQGALERMSHGVYRVAGAPAGPTDEVRAAWLGLDPRRMATERLRDDPPEVVSHRSAAALHDLGDLAADRIEFTVAGRAQSRRPDVRFHRGQVAGGEWTLVDGLPVTTVVRTVTDLAAARIDGGHLASVVRDALTVKQVDADELVEALRPHAHHYGVALGDGEALVSRFLQESGVSRSTEKAVELVHQGRREVLDRQLSEAVRRIAARVSIPDLTHLTEVTQQIAGATQIPDLDRFQVQIAKAVAAIPFLELDRLFKEAGPVATAARSPEMVRIAREASKLAQTASAPDLNRLIEAARAARGHGSR